MIPRKLRPWLAVPALLVGMTMVWWLQEEIDLSRAGFEQKQDDSLVRSPELLKFMSLEYRTLVGHVYWTRAVQYYGSKASRPEQSLTELWPLLDAATTLDPQLLVAYYFGGAFLSEPKTRGAGRPDLAIQLIEKGIRQNSQHWRLYGELGYIYYFNLKDYAKASAAFLEGSKDPAAAIWMKVMAARIMEQGESRETSKFLWSEIYSSTKDPVIRRNAATHLQLLRVEEDTENLDRLVAAYSTKFGHAPENVRTLVNAGFLEGEPVDPLGYPYVLAGGKTRLNPRSPLQEDLAANHKPG